MGVCPYRFPPSSAMPCELPALADRLVNDAKETITAMAGGNPACIIEASLEIMHTTEGILRTFPDEAVSNGYLYTVETHARRGEYDTKEGE